MRSEKEKLANYTELVHAGDGVTIEKGVISASGGNDGFAVVNGTYDSESGAYTFSYNEIVEYIENGVPFVLSYTDAERGAQINAYITQIEYDSTDGFCLIYTSLFNAVENMYLTILQGDPTTDFTYATGSPLD